MSNVDSKKGVEIDSLDRLVRPGDRLLIAITFPAELDDSEACHSDIVLEDFLASRNDGSWQVEIHSILPNDRSDAQRRERASETKEGL